MKISNLGNQDAEPPSDKQLSYAKSLGIPTDGHTKASLRQAIQQAKHTKDTGPPSDAQVQLAEDLGIDNQAKTHGELWQALHEACGHKTKADAEAAGLSPGDRVVLKWPKPGNGVMAEYEVLGFTADYKVILNDGQVVWPAQVLKLHTLDSDEQSTAA